MEALIVLFCNSVILPILHTALRAISALCQTRSLIPVKTLIDKTDPIHTAIETQAVFVDQAFSHG